MSRAHIHRYRDVYDKSSNLSISKTMPVLNMNTLHLRRMLPLV